MISTRMPFGKFRGRPVNDLPVDYVAWVRENIELREPLKTAIETRYRELTQVVIPRGAVDLNALRRRFAAKYHPDRPKGSRDAMSAVNDVFDCLREEMGAAQ